MSASISAVQTPPRHRHTPSVKLLSTLAVAGVLAGALIVTVFQWTLPTILEHREARLHAAILEVVPHAVSSQPLYLFKGALVRDLPRGTDDRALERIYVAYDAGSRSVGYAIPTSDPGFADDVHLIFGFDAGRGEVLGMKVLENRETAGVGDKIERDPEFVAGFTGAHAPVRGVRAGTKHETGDVDMITGATISSRTVIRAINKAFEKWRGPIAQWEKGARR